MDRMGHIILQKVNFRFIHVYIISLPNVFFQHLALATRCDPNFVYPELLIKVTKSPTNGGIVGIMLGTLTFINAVVNVLAWPVLYSWVAKSLVERLSLVFGCE